MAEKLNLKPKFFLFSLVYLWQKTRILRYLLNFSSCRFYPSCSDYFLEAIEKHGLKIGSLLFIKRLLRCHPISSGGIDEVPGNGL